jgi:hypothetical protein
MHQKEQNDVGACPTRLPPTKHGRTSHPDLQKPFCSNPQWGRRQVPTLAVVPPRTTGRTHRQPTATKQRGPEDFSVRTRTRTGQLHAKFAPLGCSVMAHVKPKNRRTWDTHGEVGFNIGTLMEHHQCFHVCIVKTRATRVSDLIFFKHQCITNPQVTPETLDLKAAAELTSALRGTVSWETETADALAKVSELFVKLAESKAAQTTAREQRNENHTHPAPRRAVPPPRVEQPTAPPPRVQIPTVDDCRALGGRRQIVRPQNKLQIATPQTTLQIESVTAPGETRAPQREAKLHLPGRRGQSAPWV